MGDRSLSTLLASLQFDEHPLTNQFMYVEEQNTADGSFITSTIIKDQIERNHNVVLVVCHHSLGHFHSISQKLGFNLLSLMESGAVYVIDILEKITNDNFLLFPEPLKVLYDDIQKQLEAWGNEKGACIILENLSDLLLAGVKDFLTFINYLRTIISEQANSSVVLLMHNFLNCPNFSVVTKSIRHTADVTVFLKDLETGRANDITGYFTVRQRKGKYSKKSTEYQYHLQDKSVHVFTPGARSFSC